jgi:hypothetical protein
MITFVSHGLKPFLVAQALLPTRILPTYTCRVAYATGYRTAQPRAATFFPLGFQLRPSGVLFSCLRGDS